MNLFPLKRLQVLLPLPLKGVLDYGVGEDLVLREGDFVMVPLSGRSVQGVVWRMGGGDVPEEKLKLIESKLDLPPLPDSLRDFIDWVAAYSMAPPGAVLKMALSVPRSFKKAKMKTLYRLAPDQPEKMSKQRRRVMDCAIGDLLQGAQAWAELAAVGIGTVRGMIKDGTLLGVEIFGEEPFAAPDSSLSGPPLSAEQETSAKHLGELIGAGGYKTVLLEGITGSGKTEVYFEAIAAALKNPDSQVLVLVPEIALTTQWLERFQVRFGAPPIVWHSELTPAQRRRAWWSVVRGEGRVVVGARSALFLPFKKLGLIIVDEEHSQTFKQEDGVIYQGRDMAVLRGLKSDCPVVLASATPSLETMINAQNGKYDWLYLGERHGPARLPDMRAVDLRTTVLKTGTWISPPLQKAMAENLADREQTLIYLNRRGYAPLTLCRSCGHRFECPHCSAWLVEHRTKSRLLCHHCGYNAKKPEICPECDAEDSLVACGPGVERVAEEAAALFPDARLLVMASDEMTTPGEIRNMIGQIERHEVDIIVGTQIVTKGYHFPLLTLVGVIDADLGLGGADPRAAERTWQQLEQVAGRAGRGEKPGQVIFQTYNPGHPVLGALLSGDRDAFLESEAASREEQNLPPFGKLASLILSSPDRNSVVWAGRALARVAPHSEDIQVLGPVAAPLSYLRGKYRYRLLVKAKAEVNIQSMIRQWLAQTPKLPRVTLQIDIDPYGFW